MSDYIDVASFDGKRVKRIIKWDSPSDCIDPSNHGLGSEPALVSKQELEMIQEFKCRFGAKTGSDSRNALKQDAERTALKEVCDFYGIAPPTTISRFEALSSRIHVRYGWTPPMEEFNQTVETLVVIAAWRNFEDYRGEGDLVIGHTASTAEESYIHAMKDGPRLQFSVKPTGFNVIKDGQVVQRRYMDYWG